MQPPSLAMDRRKRDTSMALCKLARLGVPTTEGATGLEGREPSNKNRLQQAQQ